MKKVEEESKVVTHKYPEILKIIEKVYKAGYNSGKGGFGDDIDGKSAYWLIEEIIIEKIVGKSGIGTQNNKRCSKNIKKI